MDRTVRMILIAWLVAAVPAFCGAMPVSSVLSDSKFVSRIEKKQSLLVCMGRDIDRFDMASGRRMGEASPGAAGDKENGESRLSNLKYVSRLENKLLDLVKESIRDMDQILRMTPRHILTNGLVPAKQDDTGEKKEADINEKPDGKR